MVGALVAFIAALAWNVGGPGVRALLDAEADGTLCAIAATHLFVTLAAAVGCGALLRWSLGPSLAGRLGSLGVAGALMLVAAASLEADSIGSLGAFAESNACAAATWRVHVLGGAFGLLAVVAAWPRREPRAGAGA